MDARPEKGNTNGFAKPPTPTGAHIGHHINRAPHGPMGPQGPLAPQGTFLGPLGPQGPHQRHRGTQGEPPEPPGGSGSIFGTPRILASRRPPGGLPAAGLPAAFSGLAAAPSPCCPASGMPPAVFSRQKTRFSWKKNDMFRKKVTCTSEKKVLREGSPGPGTPLDRRGPGPKNR